MKMLRGTDLKIVSWGDKIFTNFRCLFKNSGQLLVLFYIFFSCVYYNKILLKQHRSITIIICLISKFDLKLII